MSDLNRYLEARDSYDERVDLDDKGGRKFKYRNKLRLGVYEGVKHYEGTLDLSVAGETIEYTLDSTGDGLLVRSTRPMDDIDELVAKELERIE